MKSEYLLTKFISAMPIERIPSCFAVITAYNPNGQLRDEAMNLLETERLRKKIEADNRIFFSVIGCSDDYKHQEPGFGIILGSRLEAIELGKLFHQDAVFWIEDGLVYLLSCDVEAPAFVGKWAEIARV